MLSSTVLITILITLMFILMKGYSEKQFENRSEETLREYQKAMSEGRLDQFKVDETFMEDIGVNSVVINDEGKIIFSTIPSLVQDDDFFTSIKSFLSKDSPGFRYSIGMISRYMRDFDDDFLFFIREREKQDILSFLGSAKYYILSAFFVLLLLIVIIYSSIIRSIVMSIVKLDNETRNISPFRLDKKITVTGSEEIQSLAHSFNLMRSSIRTANIRRSQFIMGLSHDFKTPLALIKGYAEVMKSGQQGINTGEKNYIEIITSKVDQLEGMMDDLLDFISIDTDARNFSFSKVNLLKWLSYFISRSKSDAQLLGKTITGDIHIEEKKVLSMNDKLVERALDNIVHNALRYTGKNGVVTIIAYEASKDICIAIADNGPGISEEDIPFIFDSFYRGSPSRRTQGMGLGLAVVKSIIDLHGWSISIDSKVGHGTTFQIMIPH